MPVFECGTVWSPLAEGPFFNGTLVPRIQLAILKTSKIMSWPRLARPRDLVGSLVWRGDDRATEIFFLCPSGGLRSASESPCSACLTPYTQTCPACLPVLLCLLSAVLLLRMPAPVFQLLPRHWHPLFRAHSSAGACHLCPAGLSTPIISSILIHLFRSTTITPPL